MTSKYQMLRSTTFGNRPIVNARPAGNPFVNFADKQFGVVDTSGTPQDLIGVRFFSTLANYNPGMVVNYQGALYQALTTITAGAFNPTQWSALATQQWTNSLGSAGGFVNVVRNGNFAVSQRGSSFTVPANNLYPTYDGWYCVSGGSFTMGGSPLGGVNGSGYIYLNGQSGDSYTYIQQNIESSIANKLAGQIVTFQCWIYNNAIASISPQLSIFTCSNVDNFGSYNLVGNYSLQTIPNQRWTQCAYTFQMPNAASNGVVLRLVLGTYQTGYVAVSTVDMRATPTAAIGITSSPPPPEMRPVSVEMVMGYRYYQIYRSSSIGSACAPAGTGWYGQTTFNFPMMRATPTVYLPNQSFSGICDGIQTESTTPSTWMPELHYYNIGGWGVLFDLILNAEL